MSSCKLHQTSIVIHLEDSYENLINYCFPNNTFAPKSFFVIDFREQPDKNDIFRLLLRAHHWALCNRVSID